MGSSFAEMGQVGGSAPLLSGSRLASLSTTLYMLSISFQMQSSQMGWMFTVVSFGSSPKVYSKVSASGQASSSHVGAQSSAAV